MPSSHHVDPAPAGDSEPHIRALAQEAIKLVDAGDWSGYLQLSESVLADHPGDPHVKVHRARALRFVGRAEDARRELREAVEAAPEDPTVLTLAASQLFDLGEYSLSQELVDRAGRLVELSEFTFGSDLVHLAGQLAATQGDNERARILLEAAVDVGPDEVGHQRYVKVLADFLIRLGELDDARSLVNHALDDHPDDRELHALLEETNRAAWLRAVEVALAPGDAAIRCPSNGDGDLKLGWQEPDESGRQIGRLYCPSCGEHVSVELS